MSEQEQEKEIEATEWDQQNISSFFDLLLKIDMRQNPELYKVKNYD